ncbi:uncharacterized protein EDB93DRAFT_14598 [Suillus bovinus]|uniref:uncharacterized protein n=1 Tax=Suillus bovinus TaxID=48563 RepID=UPI001B8805CE|nr:uncharacterized protein EDB93DRAFT_14598 [Suillus bovinus]KAG2159760.1 hypothetical protein EDB93DRAFT_14598 [Suillus bovinus]
MSNSQTPDARTALMQSVLSRHLQAKASSARVSRSSLLRRPSRNFNAQDFAGHRKQAASPSKRKAREDNIALAIRGRTIYDPRANPVAHSAPKTSSSRKKLMTPSAPSYHPLGTGVLLKEKALPLSILQRMETEEEHRVFLMKAGGASTPSYHWQARDNSPWMGISESDPDCHMPGSSTPSDMEYSPSLWNAPNLNSGEGDWETMFDMYINLQEE